MDTIQHVVTLRASLTRSLFLKTNIVRNSLTVTLTDLTPFTEGTDFTVDYRSGVFTCLTTGAIPDNTNLVVTYSTYCTKLETLVNRLQGEITKYDDFPNLPDYTHAIKNSVSHLNTRVRYWWVYHFYIEIAGSKVYQLPEHIYKPDNLIKSDFSPIGLTWNFSSSDYPELVFETLPTTLTLAKLTYYGTHILDGEVYPFMSDSIAQLVLLKAKHLLLMQLAERTAAASIQFSLADRSFDKRQVSIQFSSRARETLAEFERQLGDYIGRLTIS